MGIVVAVGLVDGRTRLLGRAVGSGMFSGLCKCYQYANLQCIMYLSSLHHTYTQCQILFVTFCNIRSRSYWGGRSEQYGLKWDGDGWGSSWGTGWQESERPWFSAEPERSARWWDTHEEEQEKSPTSRRGTPEKEKTSGSKKSSRSADSVREPSVGPPKNLLPQFDSTAVLASITQPVIEELPPKPQKILSKVETLQRALYHVRLRKGYLFPLAKKKIDTMKKEVQKFQKEYKPERLLIQDLEEQENEIEQRLVLVKQQSQNVGHSQPCSPASSHASMPKIFGKKDSIRIERIRGRGKRLYTPTCSEGYAEEYEKMTFEESTFFVRK